MYSADVEFNVTEYNWSWVVLCYKDDDCVEMKHFRERYDAEDARDAWVLQNTVVA